MKVAKQSLGIIAVVSMFIFAPLNAFAAETFEDLVKRSQTLKGEGRYVQALDELSWARKKLEDLHVSKLQSFLPKEVEGLKQGNVKTSNVLGLLNIEQTFKDGAGARMKLTLIGSAGGKGAAQGMGALAGFAQMAAAMDGANGSESVRIHGQRGTISSPRGKIKFSMPLKSGLMLQIEQTGGTATKQQMIAIAEGVDVKNLNAYLTN